jgi:hypothetical protein
MKEVRTTLLIFGWSIPFLVFLWSLNLFYFDRFFETPIFSLRAPLDYPYSFAIALFFSLCYGAIALWIYQVQRSDFNPVIICLGALIGLLGSIFSITRIDIYNRSFSATIFFLLGTTLLSVLIFVIFLFLFFSISQQPRKEILRSAIASGLQIATAFLTYLFPFTLIFIITIFLACQFPINKPQTLRSRLFYSSPLIAVVIVPYFLLINTYFPIGTVIPISIRYEWGMKNFLYTYEAESELIKTCDLIKKYIGDVTATALVEDKNAFYGGITPSDSYSMFTLELVGNKGSAIVKTCSSSRCPRTNFIGRIISNSGMQEVDIFPCLNLN